MGRVLAMAEERGSSFLWGCEAPDALLCLVTTNL